MGEADFVPRQGSGGSYRLAAGQFGPLTPADEAAAGITRVLPQSDEGAVLYLQEPVAIIATPTEQSIRGLRQRTEAIWQAVERACIREDFRPRPSRLCDYCNFQAYCPAFGGDPSRASELLVRASA